MGFRVFCTGFPLWLGNFGSIMGERSTAAAGDISRLKCPGTSGNSIREVFHFSDHVIEGLPHGVYFGGNYIMNE